jgi:Kae1-associated kinase Bud32
MLSEAPVRVPKVVCVDEFSIVMERVHGQRLRDELNQNNVAKYASELGAMISGIHAEDIIHGDLTTSNVLVETKSKELVLIDFGLSNKSKRIEEKAVDLHVLKETLEGSHPLLKDAFWDSFVESYKHSAVLERLKAVEKRGRNKAKY